MADTRRFSESEIDAARSMRASGLSWRALGRVLGCHEDTIRCALDGEYRQLRHTAIATQRRVKRRALRAAADALAEETARRTALAYKPSGL